MPKKFPNWSQDLGLKTAIAPHTPKIDPADHGLKGALAEGRLSFSRLNTRAKAKEDAAAGLPPSDAATPDQWSEREQLIAAEAEDVRRGVASWFSANAASVKNFILDATPADLSTEQLKEAIKTGEADLRHFELDDASEAENTHEAAKRELTDFQSRHKEQIGERT
ncbi:MAG: hypothetical protein AAFQ67_04390, partial [Pseudomonadota bacterium]